VQGPGNPRDMVAGMPCSSADSIKPTNLALQLSAVSHPNLKCTSTLTFTFTLMITINQHTHIHTQARNHTHSDPCRDVKTTSWEPKEVMM